MNLNFTNPRLYSFIAVIGLLIASLFSSTIHSIFFILAFLPWLFISKVFISKHKAINLAVILFFAVQTFEGILRHSEGFNFLNVPKDFLKYCGFWFLCSSLLEVTPRKELRLGLLLASLSGAFVSLFMLLQAVGLIDTFGKDTLGFQKQPFTTAQILLMFFFITLDQFRRFRKSKNTKLKTLLIFILGTLLLGIILIGQRAVWLGCFASLIFLIVIYRKKIGMVNIFKGLLFTSLSGLVAYFISPRIRLRVSSILDLKNDKTGLGCRLELWKLNLTEILKNPFFGKGKAVEMQCFDAKLGHAHNIYIQKMVEGGIFVFLPWILIFIFAIQKLLQLKRFVFLAGLLGLMLVGVFENWWGDSEVLSCFWFFLALSLK
jgi:hypothetical protein